MNIFKTIVIDILPELQLRRIKWYRADIGGTWYKVLYKDPGISDFVTGDYVQWQQHKPVEHFNIKILDTEEY